MKNLIITLLAIILLGSHLPPDDNLYETTLPEITVKANILEGFKPQRARTNSIEEFVKLNNPLVRYIAKYTVLTQSQLYSFLKWEQGKGSYIYTRHNNPFNVKAHKSKDSKVLATTWEYTKDNVVDDYFQSHKTIQSGAEAFIEYFNRRFSHIKAGSNKEVFTQLRYGKDNKGNAVMYHTDYSHLARAKTADKFEEYLNKELYKYNWNA